MFVAEVEALAHRLATLLREVKRLYSEQLGADVALRVAIAERQFLSAMNEATQLSTADQLALLELVQREVTRH